MSSKPNLSGIKDLRLAAQFAERQSLTIVLGGDLGADFISSDAIRWRCSLTAPRHGQLVDHRLAMPTIPLSHLGCCGMSQKSTRAALPAKNLRCPKQTSEELDNQMNAKGSSRPQRHLRSPKWQPGMRCATCELPQPDPWAVPDLFLDS
eukprot:1443500-Amphidinium_carterae.2